MSTTPSSAVRRPKQQVYVDVPRSPYPTASAFSHKPAPVPALTSLTLKENTPLRPSNGGTTRPVDEFQTLKRKTSDLELTSFKATNAKKQKLAEPLAEQQLAQPDVHGRLPLLNDFVYCHQCSQKRDVAASVHCNSTKIVKGIKKQCRIKFCFPCLKNRYGEDVVEIKAHGINGVYNFKCPKCRDICNCSNCRKLKGLPVMGTTSVEMPKPEIVVSRSPQPAKKTVEVFITTFPPKGAFSKKAAKAQSDSRKSRPKVSTGTKLKVDAKPKQQTLQQMIPQVLPALKWTQVPTNLDLHEAESRFQIREFVLRFASVMEPPIPRNQLAELDDLGCGSNDEEIAPWVSEACVRSIILGLLGMLASSKGETQKLLKSATRDIRATGNNLTKMWPILAKLRDALSGYAQVTYPDPLPLPASATIYATRTTCSAGDSNGGRPNVTIGRSAQMIPVVEALIEAAIESPVAHGEIDDGVGDCKELVREVQKAVREENERWDAERKILEADKEKEKEKEASEKQVKEKLKSKTALEIKLKREVHKARLRDLDHALRLLTAGFAPRFAPLGADTSGRTFWTASPGVGERKAALDFIASASKKAKAKAFTLDNDTSTKWSWFLAVWGKKIPTAVAAPATENDKDEDVERWWAFSEPIEIRKLADWIRIDAGINPYDELDGNKPLALLVKGLSDYAALLDWRLKEDKYEAA